MEEISWLDKVTDKEILRRVNKDRQILNSIWHRKHRWIGHVLRHDGLLHEINEGRMRDKPTRGRRIQTLHDLASDDSHVALKQAAEPVPFCVCCSKRWRRWRWWQLEPAAVKSSPAAWQHSKIFSNPDALSRRPTDSVKAPKTKLIFKSNLILMLTNPRDAFRDQWRSPNMVPFDREGWRHRERMSKTCGTAEGFW